MMTFPRLENAIHVRRQMVHGSLWTIAIRWATRLTGLVSTLILARLLTPTDYGIVSIAALIVGIAELFTQSGMDAALIRHPHPTREHYDSAWTLGLITGLGLGLVTWVLTPLTTSYFHEPRAETIVRILSVRLMLTGCSNIGVVNFRRNLEFSKQFWFNVIPLLVSFPVTLTAAFLLRNYWALVIGLTAQYLTNFILSYLMDSFRPRLSLSRIGEIWSFSGWALFKNMGYSINLWIDRIAIGGYAGAAAMGRYYVATDLSTAPTGELAGPIINVLFPVMATVQDDRIRRRELYLTVLYWSALVCSSTAIGVALISNDMVDLVLGSKWQEVKPLMPWLALSFGLLYIGNGAYMALDAIGMPRTSALLQWTRLAVFSFTIVPVAFYFHDVRLVAVARLLGTIAIFPTLFMALMKPFDLTTRDIAVVLWRPTTAGAMMAVAVLGLNQVIPFAGNGRLLADIALGAVTYTSALMMFWFAAGQPPGPERSFWMAFKKSKFHQGWNKLRVS